jgi:hypothetical protein
LWRSWHLALRAQQSMTAKIGDGHMAAGDAFPLAEIMAVSDQP